MKNTVLGMAGIAACAFLAGCASAPMYFVSEQVNPADNVHAAPPPPPAPVAAVVVKPADDGAAGIAEHVKAAVENDLASRGFSIASGAPADVTVSAEVTRRTTDTMGEWHKFSGTERVRIVTSLDKRQIANATFSAEGERSTDVLKAESRIREGLAKQTTDWLAKSLTVKQVPVRLPPVSAPCARARLTITPSDAGADKMETLAVQKAFMDAVMAEPGVLDCRLAAEKRATKSYEFIVTYDAVAFPDGLLNTIILKNPGFGEPPCTFSIVK